MPSQNSSSSSSLSSSSINADQEAHLLRGYTDHEKVHEDEHLPPQIAQPQTRNRRGICNALLFIASVLATSSLFAALFTSTQSPTNTHRQTYSLNSTLSKEESFPTHLTCGYSPSEARSKNCTFDLMLSTWIHESCADNSMMETYLSQGKYHYFRDKDRTIPMTEEEARRGEYKTLWTDGEFHLAHCVYLMDMQIRAYKIGRPVEVGIFNHRHTMHCVNLTLGLEGEVHGRVTKLHALFGGCGFPRGQ